MFKKYFRSRATTKLGLISRINCSSISRNICESTFRLGQLQNLFVYYTTFTLTAKCLKITQNVAFDIFNFGIAHQFCPILKLTCLITLFDRKHQVFKKSLFGGIFNELLSTQNVNITCFARNVN